MLITGTTGWTRTGVVYLGRDAKGRLGQLPPDLMQKLTQDAKSLRPLSIGAYLHVEDEADPCIAHDIFERRVLMLPMRAILHLSVSNPVIFTEELRKVDWYELISEILQKRIEILLEEE
jgi:hypothetical protein